MPFVSSVSKFVLTINKVANLPRPGRGHRHVLPPWEPDMCNGFQQEDISNAFFSLANSQIPEIEKHGGDWKKLADLMKKKTVDSVFITCGTCSGQKPMSSNAEHQSLQVCLETSYRDWLAAWLVVEVVHLCGGTDLDAWAVKNWLFSVDKSGPQYAYYSLLSSEKDLMCAGSTPVPPYNWRAGKFTVWDNVGGNLWPSDRALAIPSNPVPAYGTSLIDGGPPRGIWHWSC
jgi:hypothetical protein